MRIFSYVLCLFTILLLSISASFAAGDLKKDALACDNVKDFSARVVGCTDLLNNPKLPAKLRPVALFQRAQGYVQTGQPELALPDIDAAIQANPKSVEYHITRASIYLFIGPPERAIEALNRALELAPNLARVHFALAQALTSQGKTDQAMMSINKAIQLDPKFAGSYAVRARIWARKKQFDFALADADEAVKRDPDSRTGYATRCDVFSDMGSFDNAIADCTKMFSIKQTLVNDSATFHDRAVVYFKKGDFDSSLKDFNDSLRLDPQNASSYVERADVWRAKGDFDRALEDLNRGLQINNNLAKAYTSQGALYEAQGEIEKAKQAYKTAVGLPDRVGTRGYKQTFIDDSTREKETAKARLAALEQTDSIPQKKAEASPSSSSSPAPLQRIALVIGNGAYKHAPALANPSNDAKAISQNLRSIGFQVFDGIDLDRAGMKTQIAQFIRAAATANIAVLFYAGHGMQIDGRNYLVPTDLDFSDAKSVASDMPDLDFVLAGLDDKLRTSIIILDACRDNPMIQGAQASASGRSVASSGLAAPAGLGTGGTVGAGTLLAFATAPGKVALDGEGANSPFSTALARHIATPNIEVQQMLTRVRSDVVAATNSKQVPWSNSSLLGEVFLVKGK